jgi:hypothetical protein
MAQNNLRMEKQKILERQQQILDLVGEFCKGKLDNDYFELSKNLTLKLGRKRNVPFITGQPRVWAAAIIHALGSINFLFDKSFEPYITLDELTNFFGTTKSTTVNKSKQIRDMLKFNYYDKEFSIGKMQIANPFKNLVMMDGFIVPLETLSEEYQQVVRQARAEGKDITFTSKNNRD